MRARKGSLITPFKVYLIQLRRQSLHFRFIVSLRQTLRSFMQHFSEQTIYVDEMPTFHTCQSRSVTGPHSPHREAKYFDLSSLQHTNARVQFWPSSGAVNEHLTEEGDEAPDHLRLHSLWRILTDGTAAQEREELFQLSLRRRRMKEKPPKKLECYHGGSLTSRGSKRELWFALW